MNRYEMLNMFYSEVCSEEERLCDRIGNIEFITTTKYIDSVLKNGDKIYITDNSGKKLTYTIYDKFETSDTDTSFYQRDTGGKAEITLSTCTDDSKARLIILAKAE